MEIRVSQESNGRFLTFCPNRHNEKGFKTTKVASYKCSEECAYFIHYDSLARKLTCSYSNYHFFTITGSRYERKI